MSEQELSALERRLEEVAAKLKETRDPNARKQLLHDMRQLLAKLDARVAESKSTKPHWSE